MGQGNSKTHRSRLVDHSFPREAQEFVALCRDLLVMTKVFENEPARIRWSHCITHTVLISLIKHRRSSGTLISFFFAASRYPDDFLCSRFFSIEPAFNHTVYYLETVKVCPL